MRIILGIALAVCLALTGAFAQPVDLAAVNDDTPITVGLFSQIAEETLPAVVSIKIYPKFTEQEKERLKRIKDFQDNPGDHLDDPEYRWFTERFFNPGFRDLKEFLENPEQVPLASGAGVIFDDQGHIVTNLHVIGGSDARRDLEVRLYDGSRFRGKDVSVVSEAPLVDLAVLKIEPGEVKLTPARWGDSDKTRIAEHVLAIGHPLDLDNTVSAGIISARGRRIDKATVEDHFQTTAMINPGNSGGALVNMHGEVIGINIAIATSAGSARWQGIGFAVPSKIVKNVVDNLIKSGREGFGYLGVQMVTAGPPIDRRLQFLRWHDLNAGVLVEDVVEGGPARQAGVQPGDIIAKVDSRPIAGNEDLVQSVARRPVGDIVSLDILRPGVDGALQELNINVKLAERPSQTEISKQLETNERRAKAMEPPAEKPADPPLGLEYEATGGGLKVTRVLPGALASKSELREGDLVVKVNYRDVRSAEDLKAAVDAVGKRASHWIHFERDGVPLWTLAPVKLFENGSD